MVLVLVLVVGSFPISLASQELVENGGFESGKSNGWTATNSKVLKQTSSVPSHSGAYSARIGTSTSQGEISQTVQIPAKSSGKFTAWFRLEKDATLSISLKKGDGSVVQDWSKTGISGWTSVSYSLDASYSGQNVTIDFTGMGHRETIIISSICASFDPVTGAYFTYPCSYPSSNDYYAYVDDASLASQIVIYQADLSVTGLPEGLSSKLSVDGAQKDTITGGQSKSLQFNLGENHKISVDAYVYKDNQTRYHCTSDSATVDADRSVTFSYSPEYYLFVSSQFGVVTGSGWYDEGSQASFSIDQNAFPMTGLIGSLGAKFVFEKWGGDTSATSTKGEIEMNAPKSVSAIWKTDYTFLYVSVVVIAAVIAGGGSAAYSYVARRRRPLKAPVETPVKLPDDTLKAKEAETATTKSSPEERELVALLERLEKSHLDGAVAEKTYQKLKAEFEKRLADTRARGAG